ncbi:hypothetical protein WEU32_06770 [Brevundimonas sp. BH3]|uniref:hypothetical protein n=1 Tax=Brevundimonas sp. BH3 TaxID=3133089 RepID=UPI003255CFA2
MSHTVFEDYFVPILTPHLSNGEIKRLLGNLGKPSSFLDTFIKPQVYCEDQGHYLHISSKFDETGRDHIGAKGMLDNPEDWPVQTYFTNALRIDTNTIPARPMERTDIGPFYIFTFEHDENDISFFKDQLNWAKHTRQPRDSMMGQFDTHLASQFKDYAGCCMVWSGNKSFHCHFAFSTDELKAMPITSLRDGFRATWHTLQGQFKTHFAIPAHIKADASLQRPEQLRRLPNGIRAGGPKIFGVTDAQVVTPQVVVFENIRVRNTGNQSVFSPSDFIQSPTVVAKRAATSSRKPVTLMNNNDEMEYCAAKMRSIFTSFPKFEGFKEEGGKLTARFLNGPDDQNPASIMDEDHRTILIRGKTDDNYPKARPLPLTLGEMVQNWIVEFNASKLKPMGEKRSHLEQTFADTAKDRQSAVQAISDVMTDLVLDGARLNLLSAAEGISKSRSLFVNMRRYFAVKDMRTAMVAFSTYELAKEKCKEFNTIQTENKTALTGIVLFSHARIYAIACEKLKIKPFTVADSVSFGDPSLDHTIKTRQPAVSEMIEKYFNGIILQRTNKTVFFTVHDVAHGWHRKPSTRRMISACQSFEDIKKDTAIDLLIHDEVSVDNLVTLAPMEYREWITRLSFTKHEGKRLWTSSTSPNDKFKAFKKYSETDPVPAGLTFETACELFEAKVYETVTLANSNEYAMDLKEDSPFNVAGQQWTIHIKPWPVYQRTLVLTTEALPATLSKKIAYVNEEDRIKWMVTELDTPHIARSPVEVRPSTRVTSKTGGLRIAEFTAANPSFKPIGNKLKGVVGSNTHHTAKGSNAYLGLDIVQLLTCLPPTALARLEAINAWLGIGTAVRLYHIDQFNQTCGRNLGFRAPVTGPAPKNIVLANRSVWNAMATIIYYSRYAVAIQEVAA